MTRRTKIVATVGPASESVPMLRKLMDAGVDVVRLNLSHGELDEHLVKLANVREAAAECGRPVAVLADLPGPKIRSGRFPEGGAVLEPGATIHLRPGDEPSERGPDVRAVRHVARRSASRRASGLGRRRDPDDGASTSTQTRQRLGSTPGGGPTASRGSTSSPTCCASRRPPKKTSCSPKRWRPPGWSSWLGVVRTRGDRRGEGP